MCLQGPGDSETDDSDMEEVAKKRVTKALRATTTKHKLNHKPALSDDCEDCMVGKLKAPRKYKGASERHPESYGEIWTMDHVYMRDWFGQPGIGGFSDFLSVKDRFTDRKYFVPVDSKDTLDTYDALLNLKGKDKVERVYCDGFKSFQKAIKMLGAAIEPCQPGVHQTNAVIERANSDSLSGTRASLVGAGHPSCFWSYAGPCYVFLDAITQGEDGSPSPYAIHTGKEFDGIALPYGTGVFFRPSPTKYSLSKADPRMQYGVLLGYRLAPGGIWIVSLKP